MGNFIVRSLVFGLLFSLIIWAFSYSLSTKRENDYLASMIDKHAYAASISSPRVLIAGGSNLAFGINSKSISDSIGMNVANLGLHAGLGTELILNELKDIADSGDIVILSLAYMIGNGNSRLKKRLFNVVPEATAYYKFSLKERLEMTIEETRQDVLNLLEKGNEGLTITEKDVYSRKYFNVYGDMVGHLDEVKKEHLTGFLKLEYRYWEGIDLINSTNSVLNERGVKMYFLFPPYPRSYFKKNRAVLQSFEKDMTENLDIPCLNTLESGVMPDSLFFDTVFHLNARGREVRSIELTGLIKPLVK